VQISQEARTRFPNQRIGAWSLGSAADKQMNRRAVGKQLANAQVVGYRGEGGPLSRTWQAAS
jgi:hypothetical protein